MRVITDNPRILRAAGLTLAMLSFYSTLFLRVYWGPLAPYLEAEGVERELIGLVGSMFFAGYIASQIPSGVLADKKSPGYTMGVGLLASGSSNIILAITDPVLWPYISIVSGFFAGMVYGPSIKLIKELFQEDTERAMGIYSISWSLPFLIAPWSIPYIASSWGIVYAHIVSSLGAIVVGIIDIVLLRDIATGGSSDLEISMILEILRRYLSRVALSSIGGFLVLFYNWVIAYWLYYYIVISGVSAIEASTTLSVYSLVGIVSTPFAGILARRFGLYRLLIVDLIIYSASGAWIALTPTPPILYLLAGLLGMARYITTPLNSSILALSFEERVLATASSAVNMFWQISGLAAPYITALGFGMMSPKIVMLSLAMTPALAIIPYAMLVLVVGKNYHYNN
ncbi:MAG: MFS transporter [Sulfolobales archaeon]